MWIALSILVAVAVLALASCQAVRAGHETAPYTVVRADGKFEVRDYPALTVVETPMVQRGNGDDGSFMRLFRFISGNNAAKEKISMTTPVLMSASGSNTTMAFVLPARLATGDVPQPTDAAVRLQKIEAGRFAVYRFSGGRHAKNEALALERLQGWMKTNGLAASSPPVYGYFDPPWTPTFLRRNEVMLRTAAGS